MLFWFGYNFGIEYNFCKYIIDIIIMILPYNKSVIYI